MDTDYCVVYSTFPERQSAEAISKLLLDKRLVACVNILPKMTSHYIWQGQVTSGDEHLLVIKTKTKKLADLENAIISNHPYEVAEFIALPILSGNPAYLKWIDEVVDTA